MLKMSGSQFGDIKTLTPMKTTDAKQHHKNRNIASEEIAGMDHSNKCTVSMVKAPLSAARH